VVFERGTNCWNDGNYINIRGYARNVYLGLLSLVHASATSGRVFDSKTIDEVGWEKFQRFFFFEVRHPRCVCSNNKNLVYYMCIGPCIILIV